MNMTCVSNKSVENYVFYKIFIAILFSLVFVNFYLLYFTKYGYSECTIPIAIGNSNILANELESNKEINIYTTRLGCVSSNLTLFYDNKMVQRKEKLDEFYFQSPNSVELSKRCKRFKDTLVQNDSAVIESMNIRRYFTDGQVIKVLKTATLLKATYIKQGTMFKLLFHLPNGIDAIFKPKRYHTNEIIRGNPHWSGNDRHFGEVVAFYLSILLNYTNVPVAAIRKVNIEELSPVSDRALFNSFVRKNNRTCLYRVRPFFQPPDVICPDDVNIIEGSVMIHLPSNYNIKTTWNPWIRSYRCNVSAAWEIDNNYCTNVRNLKLFSKNKIEPSTLLFDIMDGSIFDFLIDNGDRHHIDYVKNNNIARMVLLDNGRSFANPHTYHIDILAPLYQCCLLRNSTWVTLQHLRGGNLSYWLRQLLTSDPDVIILEKHFKALDSKLLIIFSVLEDCFERKGIQNVIFD